MSRLYIFNYKRPFTALFFHQSKAILRL